MCDKKLKEEEQNAANCQTDWFFVPFLTQERNVPPFSSFLYSTATAQPLLSEYSHTSATGILVISSNAFLYHKI